MPAFTLRLFHLQSHTRTHGQLYTHKGRVIARLLQNIRSLINQWTKSSSTETSLFDDYFFFFIFSLTYACSGSCTAGDYPSIHFASGGDTTWTGA